MRLAFLTLLLAAGTLLAWNNPAFCITCPGYACQSNTECGVCSCAKQDGQPYGRCFFVQGAE